MTAGNWLDAASALVTLITSNWNAANTPVPDTIGVSETVQATDLQNHEYVIVQVVTEPTSYFDLSDKSSWRKTLLRVNVSTGQTRARLEAMLAELRRIFAVPAYWGAVSTAIKRVNIDNVADLSQARRKIFEAQLDVMMWIIEMTGA